MIWEVRSARVAIACAAVIVAAWFALGARQTHELNRANTIISNAGSLDAAQAAHINSILDAAGTLNPDQDVNLSRAHVALLAGDRPGAARILENIVRAEPLNIQGWVWLAQAAVANRAVFSEAIANIHRLDQIGSRGR